MATLSQTRAYFQDHTNELRPGRATYDRVEWAEWYQYQSGCSAVSVSGVGAMKLGEKSPGSD
ncbi:hypothetical protein Trisim1_003469 [Trichoderma cf. simile WF8]